MITENQNPTNGHPVLVRGWISTNGHIGFWIARVWCVAMMSILVLGPGVTEDWGFVVIVCSQWVLFESIFLYHFLGRAWLRDFGDSFEYITRFSRSTYQLADVSSLTILPTDAIVSPFSLACKSKYLSQTTYYLSLPKRSRVRLVIYSDGNGSPLDYLMARIVECYVQKVTEGFKQQVPLEGTNWKFDGEQFQYLANGWAWNSIPVNEIGAGEVIMRDFCLWNRESEQATESDPWKGEPICRLPLRQQNVSVLCVVLSTMIQPTPLPPQTPGVLGRHLFDLKTGGVLPILGIFLFSILGLAAYHEDFTGGYLKYVFGGLALFSFVYWFIPQRIEVYSHGLIRKWLFFRWYVCYEEVEKFQYTLTTHYINGAYACTEIILRLYPMAETTSQKLSLDITSFVSPAKYFSIIVGYLAKAIADRIMEELDEKGSVTWFPHWTLYPDRLCIENPKPKKNEPAMTEIPYSKIKMSGYAKEGEPLCFIIFEAEDGQTYQISLSPQWENFHPGIEVISRKAAIDYAVRVDHY